MNKFFKILKVDLINSFAFNTYKNTKKNKAKSKGPIFSIIISSLAMIFLLSIYSFSVSMMCAQVNKLDVIILYGVGLGGLLSFMMSLGKSYSILFQGKDYEFLNTLPVKTEYIMASKLTSLIIVNFAYFNLGFVPSYAMYLIFSGFNLLKLFVGLVIILTGPIFTCVVCTFLATILGVVLQKSRFKNALQIVASMLFLVLVFFSSFSISYSAGSGTEDQQAILDLVNTIEQMFSKVYFLAPMASKAMSGELLNLLWFVLISLIPLVFLVLFTSKFFVRLNERSKETYKNKNFKLDKELKKDYSKKNKNNVITTLIKKEFKTIFTNSTYAMNVLVGPLIGIVSSIVIIFSMQSQTDGMTNEELLAIKSIANLMSFIMCAFTLGISPSSATSINVEGKNFWLLKCAPVDEKTVLLAKGLTFPILCIPAIIVVPIANYIFNEIEIISVILMMITLAFISVSYSFIALWVNCLMPKLKWNNMTEAVKQSAGTLVTMVINLVLDIILFVPTGILYIGFGVNPFFVALPSSLVVFGLSVLILFTSGKKHYNKIEAF